MLALFSRFRKWLDPNGVRAPKKLVYRQVLAVVRHGDIHRTYHLECGHAIEVTLIDRAYFPCDECAQRAHAENPNRRKTAEGSAKNMKRKLYYFICRKCHKRKPVSEQAFFRPGWCQSCYSKLEIDPT